MSDPLWFKDAVVYELHVKTFQDSDGDGVGDFRGLIERLDYFVELGVTALWLLPFYPSPLRDDGYDIADYYSVHPSYGSTEDFCLFLEAAHQRGLRVITEIVLNHTSDQNAWFQRARRAAPGSPEREFYVWSDNPRQYREARIIFKDFETSNWSWDPVAKAYFWHRFYSHQPDLNFASPQVHAELLRVIDFWLAMGVDGLRLDAVPYLYEAEETNCENLPETHDFIRMLRRHIDERFPDRMLLAEANQWPEDAAAYFGQGDECHMEFHFPLMPRMFMALQMEDRYPIIDILEQTPAIPEGCQWAIFLRNHDELTLEMVTDEERDYMYRVYAHDPKARINLGIRRRLAPLLGNNRRKIELINSLLFSLPGTPIIYYGDEIGMGDNFYLGDRNGVRTPMQWTPDRNAGFSKANPQQLYLPAIIDPEYHYESVNVENQQKSLSSLFWWMRRLLAIRQQWTVFGRGRIEFLHPENAKVLAYLRWHAEEVVLVVANLSRFSQVAELDLSQYAGWIPQELFGHSLFPEIRATPTAFTLGPHGFYWLALRPSAQRQIRTSVWTVPSLALPSAWSPSLIRRLEGEILPGYLPACRWFAGQGRGLREVRLARNLPLGPETEGARLCTIEVTFVDGAPETYLLILALTDEKRVDPAGTESPPAILGRFEDGRVLCDGLNLPEVRAELFRQTCQPTPSRARTRLAGSLWHPLETGERDRALADHRIMVGEQSNTSVSFGDRWHFKFFRKFEHGPHPEIELSRFLSQEERFSATPPYVGALNLIEPEGEGAIGVLVGMVQHQGDAWILTVDALARFFERVLAARVEFSPVAAEELIGAIFPGRACQLGERTAQMHLALIGPDDQPEFAPEPFSTLYQRSLYQALRGAGGRILRQLRAQLPHLAPGVRGEAEQVLSGQAQLLAGYAQIPVPKLQAAKIRIHGDFHLGQVLNTGKDFVITDFEGEPRRPLGERRLKRSPLVDVAGMLHSFNYAAATALDRVAPADRRRLAEWAESWIQSIWGSYLEGYLEVARGAVFLPLKASEGRLLLESFLLDRALYAVGYELNHRPSLLPLALRTVLRLLEAPGAGLERWRDVGEPAAAP